MPPRSRAATPMRKPVDIPDEAPPTASMFDPDRQQTPRTPGPSRLLNAGLAAATSTPANFVPDSADNSFRSAILNASQLTVTPQRPGISAHDLAQQDSPTPSSASHGTVQERASFLPSSANQRTPVKKGIVIREDAGMVSCFDPRDEVLYKLWVG
ncbi:hypothetical protein CALCODRAFT_505338 [Calocera cornea HHB12733]|uniref:Uncharacterized protein n=1 Tax=Calocera cornea HHB12733 TaxID=1353952 RepID=A0A165KCP6_9BASI|nr:hypothetical protein CALCODRAFT_505338 [Calocera cornea HHB12733]